MLPVGNQGMLHAFFQGLRFKASYAIRYYQLFGPIYTIYICPGFSRTKLTPLVKGDVSLQMISRDVRKLGHTHDYRI